MDSIAEAAELAKGTLYLHFADKDAIAAELGRALLGRLAVDMEAVTAEVHAGRLCADAGLRRITEVWLAVYWSQPGIFRILVLDRPHLLAEFTAGVGGHGPHILAPVEALVVAGQRSGEIPLAADPAVVSHALWALFVGAVLLAGRGEISEADLRATSLGVLHALVRGLCLPPDPPRPSEPRGQTTHLSPSPRTP